MNTGDTEGFRINLYQVEDELTGQMRTYGVEITHINSGFTEKCHDSTSLSNNKRIAMGRLYNRLMDSKGYKSTQYSLNKTKGRAR